MLDKNEFYRQATLNIFSSLDIETALEQCKEYLSRHMPVSGLHFSRYDPDTHTSRIAAGIWPAHYQISKHPVALPQEWWGRMKKRWREATADQDTVKIINSHQELETQVGPCTPKTKAFLLSLYPVEVAQMNLNLTLGERHIGMLTIFAEGRNHYRQQHADLIATLQKPFAIAMSNILQHQEIMRLKDILSDDNTYLRQQMVKMSGDTVIGADTGLRDVMEMVRQVAQLGSPVLLLGETGVGKEVIANALHYSSKRKDGPFIKVNCGAIPESLMDSELFGHERGAFTGAVAQKRGRFERAHGGTIFLDEIGELPPAAQVRLLRVLQHHEIERVGGREAIPVDVRIISATHRNIEEMVHSGKFREDLWFRINVFPIMIPPLRQRIEDIPALEAHFMELKSKELKIGKRPTVSMEAINHLRTYHWPGNVRELENLVERALIRGKVDSRENLFQSEIPSPSPVPQRWSDATPIEPFDALMAAHIRRALARTGGRVEGPRGAAKLLQLKPSTLRSKMKRLGIKNNRRIAERSPPRSTSDVQ